MCRQPQQKSGSKQPWSNWYDHRTEEAMPLVRTGEGEGGREEEVGPQLQVRLPSPEAGEMPLTDGFKKEGKQKYGRASEREGERVSLKQQPQEL